MLSFYKKYISSNKHIIVTTPIFLTVNKVLYNVSLSFLERWSHFLLQLKKTQRIMLLLLSSFLFILIHLACEKAAETRFLMMHDRWVWCWSLDHAVSRQLTKYFRSHFPLQEGITERWDNSIWKSDHVHLVTHRNEMHFSVCGRKEFLGTAAFYCYFMHTHSSYARPSTIPYNQPNEWNQSPLLFWLNGLNLT